jgi:hypothetical protein
MGADATVFASVATRSTSICRSPSRPETASGRERTGRGGHRTRWATLDVRLAEVGVRLAEARISAAMLDSRPHPHAVVGAREQQLVHRASADNRPRLRRGAGQSIRRAEEQSV